MYQPNNNYAHYKSNNICDTYAQSNKQSTIKPSTNTIKTTTTNKPQYRFIVTHGTDNSRLYKSNPVSLHSNIEDIYYDKTNSSSTIYIAITDNTVIITYYDKNNQKQQTISGKLIQTYNNKKFGKNALKTYKLDFFASGKFIIYEDNMAEITQFGSGIPIISSLIGKLINI